MLLLSACPVCSKSLTDTQRQEDSGLPFASSVSAVSQRSLEAFLTPIGSASPSARQLQCEASTLVEASPLVPCQRGREPPQALWGRLALAAGAHQRRSASPGPRACSAACDGTKSLNGCIRKVNGNLSSSRVAVSLFLLIKLPEKCEHFLLLDRLLIHATLGLTLAPTSHFPSASLLPQTCSCTLHGPY